MGVCLALILTSQQSPVAIYTENRARLLRVNAINRQELLKQLTFHPKSLVFKTVSVPLIHGSFITPQNGQYNYRSITIPERGIIVGEGVFTSHKKYGTALVQHEFGHILQYREVGPHAYWGIIAPESVATSFDDSFHRNYWTETWANYLSKGYFGKDWLGETYGYFAKEISFSNWLRLKTMQSLGIIRMRPRGFI